MRERVVLFFPRPLVYYKVITFPWPSQKNFTYGGLYFFSLSLIRLSGSLCITVGHEVVK